MTQTLMLIALQVLINGILQINGFLLVDTVFCLPLICMPDFENSKNIIFSPWGRKRIYIDVGQPVRASQHSNCLFRSNRLKCPWSTLGRLKVKVSQNHHQKNIFHVFASNPSYSAIFLKFNQV